MNVQIPAGLSEEQLNEVARLIKAVAADKARRLKLDPVDYLLGILDGRFPAIGQGELAAKQVELAAAVN